MKDELTMKVHIIKREQFLARPIEDVFAFFNRPENLAKITPESLGFKILTPQPLNMKEGAIIDYTIKPLFFDMHWRTYISDYTPPRSFVDEQLKGPYKFWHHRHSFESVEGGTMVRDEVRYALPFGIFGEIAHALFIKRQLNRIFDHRTIIISEYFSRDITIDGKRSDNHKDAGKSR